MKTKYDWSNVPDEVMWIATQESGNVGLYKEEPELILSLCVWSHTSGKISYHFDSFDGDWQDSLEQRP